MDFMKVYSIVRIVTLLLAGIPGLAISGLLFRKPGYKHDNTRRWVDYTKIASGLWGTSQIAYIISHIALLVSYEYSFKWGYDFRLRDAYISIFYIAALLEIWSTIATFLALFYLAHALTQLRTDGQEDSSAYQKGRKVALGISGFLAVLNLIMFCLRSISSFSSQWNDTIEIINLIAISFGMAISGTLMICAIGSIVYSAKSRKKALGSPVQKAATILVVCSSMYLVRTSWLVVGTFFGRADLFGFIDIALGCWITLVILALLYVLAVKEEYSLSKIHYRSRTVTDSPATLGS